MIPGEKHLPPVSRKTKKIEDAYFEIQTNYYTTRKSLLRSRWTMVLPEAIISNSIKKNLIEKLGKNFFA